MYQREFEQKLKEGLFHAVLLFGESDYLVDHYIERYKEELDASESMLSLYHDEYDFDRARGYLSQSSLFGGTNLLLIRSEKKLPKRELDALVALTQKNPDNYLLVAFRGEDRDAKGMQASFSPKKGGAWVRLFEANPKEALMILRERASQLRLEIDDYTIAHLHALLNGNLALCAKEMEKLAILQRPVSSKDVDLMVYSTAPLAVERLLVDLFAKKPITETIGKLLELGEDEGSILRSTQFFLQQIFLFQAYIKIHGRADSQEILGYKLPRHIEEQKASIALKVRTSSLLKIYEHLLASELRLKTSGSESKETLLYGTMIRLQSLL